MADRILYLATTLFLVFISSGHVCWQVALGETRVWWEFLLWLIVWSGSIYLTAEYLILLREEQREDWVESQVPPLFPEGVEV